MFDNRKWFVFFASVLALVALPSAAHAQVVLPFFEDFEGASGTYTTNTASISGAPEWSFETEMPLNDGRLRFSLGATHAKSGSIAATMDQDVGSGTVENSLILTLDMSNYDASVDTIVLDFSAMHHGEETHPGDRIWTRGSSTDPWVEILNIFANQGSSGTYQDFTDINISTALQGASQQFSSTFQVRFGQEDDSATTSTTGVDGRSYDDIRIRNVLPNDVGVTAILAPNDLVCGESAQDITVEVGNFGANSQSAIPVTVTVTGDITQTFNTTVPGPLLTNGTAQITVGQINSANGVEVNIDATTTLAIDDDTANDGVNVSRTLPSLLVDVSSPPATICPGDTASIGITPETEIDYLLFDVPTDGTALAQGNPLVTPPVESSTTFYIERTNVDEQVGPADETIGMGAQYPTFSDGVVFDTAEPVVLSEVSVIPGGPGSVTVRVTDAGDNTIGSSTVSVGAADVGQLTPLEVSIPVPAGMNFRVDATGSTVNTLFRNSAGAAYPYTSNLGSVTLTGAKSGLPNAYYFFYDMVFTQDSPVCTDQRTPVMVMTDASACNADLAVTITGPDAADPGTPLEYTITVTNNGPTVAGAVQLNLTTPPDITFVSNTGDCDTAFPCALGDLAPAATATVTSTFSSPADLNANVDFTAVVSSTTPDPNGGDESATQTTQIGDPPMGVGGGGPGVGGGGVGPGAGGGDSTGSGVVLPPPPAEDEGGCTVSQPGSNDDAPWALVAAGLGLALLRRRRRAA